MNDGVGQLREGAIEGVQPSGDASVPGMKAAEG